MIYNINFENSKIYFLFIFSLFILAFSIECAIKRTRDRTYSISRNEKVESMKYQFLNVYKKLKMSTYC